MSDTLNTLIYEIELPINMQNNELNDTGFQTCSLSSLFNEEQEKYEEEVSNLLIENFPKNLNKKDTDKLFFAAIKKKNFPLLDYLIHTNNNYTIELSNPKLYSAIKDEFSTARMINNIKSILGVKIDNSFELLIYFFKVSEFVEQLDEKNTTNFIKVALDNENDSLAKYFISHGLYIKELKKQNCFHYAISHQNYDLLDFYFDNEKQYTDLSHQKNIESCFEYIIENTKYVTSKSISILKIMDYLFYEQSFEVTPRIIELCSVKPKYKEILDTYINFSNLNDKVDNISLISHNKKNKKKI